MVPAGFAPAEPVPGNAGMPAWGAFSFPQDLGYPRLWLLMLFAGDDSLGRSPGSSPAADHAKQLVCLREGLALHCRGALGLK